MGCWMGWPDRGWRIQCDHIHASGAMVLALSGVPLFPST